MSLRLAIIADDLTGALDAAAPFAGVPGGVAVATRPEALPHLKPGAGVISVSTRSREIGADAARARVTDVLGALPPGVQVFKKVDSRLKGNVEAELDPLGGPFLVAPALPEFGRVVRGGAVQGFGVAAPIPVLDRLGHHTAHSVVPDVESTADFKQALRDAGDAVLVGARGLAVALAAEMGQDMPDGVRGLAGPVAFVVGSNDEITLAQVAALRAAWPDLRFVAAPSGDVPEPDGTVSPVTLIQALLGPEREAEEVARRFAAGVRGWVEPMRSILLTGGATAEAVLDALGLDCLHLLGEALPGLPVVQADDRVIVTKSGGFGGPECFLSLLELQGKLELVGH